MSKQKQFVTLVVMVGMFLTLPLFSQGLTDNLQIHGFVSQGYLKTTDNNYLVKNSKDGSWEFSEAALTVLAKPSDRLKIGAQFFGRDMGSEGNHNLMIDWAYGDYRWRDFLGVRIGKIKSPLARYNKIRDVDVARIPIFLPQGIYDDNIREFNISMNGISLYGNIPINVLGDIDYEIFEGDVNVQNPRSDFFQNVFHKTGIGIAGGMMFIPGIISADYIGTSKESVKLQNNYGSLVSWNTPIPGLKLGGAMNRVNYKQAFHAHVDMVFPTGVPNSTATVSQAIPVTGDYGIKNKVFFTEFAWHAFNVAGEYKIMDLDGTIVIGDNTTKAGYSMEAYYGMLSYTLADWLSLGTYYSVSYPNTDFRDGADQVAMGNPDYLAWQKDLSFTACLDVTSNWLLKIEYHKINGAGQTLIIRNLDGHVENWSLFALKSTYHF